MFGAWILKLRNKFESVKVLGWCLDIFTKNPIYKRKTYSLFEKKAAAFRKNKNYILAIEVSSFCNAVCIFCPNNFMKRKKSIMSMEIFEKIVERLKNEGIRPEYFNLTGTGEPLVDRTLFEKIEVLKRNFPNTRVFFPSNFALADEKIIKKIISSPLDNISISLNANNPREYKKIMHLDYSKTIKNLKRLIELRNKSKSKLKISVTVAANPLNQKNIEKFVKKWDKKVDEISINWIHSWAGSVKNGVDKPNSPKYPCRSLFEQIVVQSNGDIPLCCVDYEGKIVGGNIMKNKIMDAFYADNLNKIREQHKSGKIDRLPMCSSCRFSDRGLYWWL